MAVGQHKAVAVRPDRILRIETEGGLPQRVNDRRHPHRGARMAGFRLLNRVNAQGANCVDADLVDRTAWRHHVVPLELNRSWPARSAGLEGNAGHRPTIPPTFRSIAA